MTDNPLTYANPAAPAGSDGPLSGLRVAVGANLSVRGWPCQAGSRALEGFTALEDATAVERLAAAGAFVAGYTLLAELGLGLHGDTSAAAILSSACDAALVTDNLGEARMAAAEAGLVGFRPTAGCVSRCGLIGLIPSMETLGVVARDPATISAVMQAISGPDERDFSMSGAFPDFAANEATGPAEAAVIPQSLAEADSDVAGAFAAALPAATAAGLSCGERSWEDWKLFRGVHQAAGSAEASSAAGKYDSVRYGHRTEKADDWNEMYIRSRAESFGPLVKAYLFQGAYFQFQDYAAFEDACRVRRQLVSAMGALLSEVDLIALPTRAGAAPAGEAVTVAQLYDRFALTLAANVAGLPAISLPGIVRSGDVDYGLQIIGRWNDDARLLALAGKMTDRRKGDS